MSAHGSVVAAQRVHSKAKRPVAGGELHLHRFTMHSLFFSDRLGDDLQQVGMRFQVLIDRDRDRGCR